MLMLGAGSLDAKTTAPNLESGSYRVSVLDGATVYHSTWRLVVSKSGAITGSSHWSCCPGARTDPLSGSASGDHVTIDRDCHGQGAGSECIRQTYVGNVIPYYGYLAGSWSGDGASPGGPNTFEILHVNVRVTHEPQRDPPINPVAKIIQLSKPHGQTFSGIAYRTPAGGGPLTPLQLGDQVGLGDTITTDPNTVLALEFTIGGRVGVNTNAEVLIISERTVADTGTATDAAARVALKMFGLIRADVVDTVLTRHPIEINNNGGASIKG